LCKKESKTRVRQAAGTSDKFAADDIEFHTVSNATTLYRGLFVSLEFIGYESTISKVTTWPSVRISDDDMCGAIGEVLGEGNGSTRR
jgi:hypothetical protein